MKKEMIKALKEMIELKWITKNEHLSLDGLAQRIVNIVETFQFEEARAKEISQMFETMRKHYPKEFENFVKKQLE